MHDGVLAAGVGALLGLVSVALGWWWRHRRAHGRCRHTAGQWQLSTAPAEGSRVVVVCLACRRERRIAGHIQRVTRSAR